MWVKAHLQHLGCHLKRFGRGDGATLTIVVFKLDVAEMQAN